MRFSSFAVLGFLSAVQAAKPGPDCTGLIPKDKSRGPGAWQPCFDYLPPNEDILANPYSNCADDGYYCKGDSKWSGMCKPIPSNFQSFAGPSVDMYIPTGCTGTENDTCLEAKNFGAKLSAADVFQGDFPPVQVSSAPLGYDNGISFLVGGDFTSKAGAEVEGKIVVLGDFIVGANGVNSLVKVGAGSHIVPEDNQVVMTVGGSYQGSGHRTGIMIPGGDVLIGGSNTGSGLEAMGQITTGASIDKQLYLDMFDDLAEKSKYWSTLYPNGKFLPAVEHPAQNTITFAAGDDECLQVFHINRFDLGCPVDGACDMKFDSSLKGKTILINVASYEDSNGDRVAELNDIGIVSDHSGTTTVASDTKASILWNVYDAKKFTLCGGGQGGAQMPGSVLIPNGGSLEMRCPGLDGRIMVSGNVVQDKGGSEFHSYEFDPPVCALPLPPTWSVPSECSGDTGTCPNGMTGPSLDATFRVDYKFGDLEVMGDNTLGFPEGAVTGSYDAFTITQKWKGAGVAYPNPITKGEDISHVDVITCRGIGQETCYRDESEIEPNTLIGVHENPPQTTFSTCCDEESGYAEAIIVVKDGRIESCNSSPSSQCGGSYGDQNALFRLRWPCGASVTTITPVPTPVPTPGPTPEPTPNPSPEPTPAPKPSDLIPKLDDCPTPPDILGSEFGKRCGNDGIRLITSRPDFSEGSGNEYPDVQIEDIFFNIDVGSDDDNRVSFRTQNPFEETVDMYVRYNKPVEAGEHALGDPASDTCEATPNVDRCGAAADGGDNNFEAVCIDPRRLNLDSQPYAYVTVYFVDKGNSLFNINENAEVHKCCQPTGIDGSSSVVSYTFVISCTCPATQAEASRSLRGSSF